MTLNVYSVEELLLALETNSDWHEGTGSVSKAQLYVTAGRRLLALRPNSASDGGSSLSFDVNQIALQINKAEKFIAANATPTNGSNSSVRFMSFTHGFR